VALRRRREVLQTLPTNHEEDRQLHEHRNSLLRKL
jgi:hypothetical protein